MANYTGRCAVRISSGLVIDVHVQEHGPNGMTRTVSPERYRADGAQPPLESLPTCGQESDTKGAGAR